MIAIIGAVREHRVSVILTGSITLIMFLSLIFTAKENKGVNIFLLILLAISVQSLIFSEMLKERQTLGAQRRGLHYLSNLSAQVHNSRSGNNNSNGTSNGSHLAAVVVYQTPGAARPSTLFMVDPEISSELAKDPPPSYFASNCPPPKYEDAIKLNAGDLSLPAVQTAASTTVDNRPTSTAVSSNATSTSTSPTSGDATIASDSVQRNQNSPTDTNTSGSQQ